MDISINSFSGRIAASHARSLLVYLSDMPRRLLRGSLRCPRDTVGRSPLRCGNAEQQACPPQMLRIALSSLPSRKSEFLEMP